MIKKMELKKVDLLFEQRDWHSVVVLLEESEKITISDSHDVKYFSYAAFSYFNLKNYTKALFYSRLLKKYLSESQYDDNDLLECMIIIEIKSYWQLNLKWKSYFSFRSVKGKLSTSATRELQHLMSEEISIRFVNGILAVSFFFMLLIGTIQYFYKIVSPSVAIFISTIITVVFLIMVTKVKILSSYARVFLQL